MERDSDFGFRLPGLRLGVGEQAVGEGGAIPDIDVKILAANADGGATDVDAGNIATTHEQVDVYAADVQDLGDFPTVEQRSEHFLVPIQIQESDLRKII